MAGNIANIEAQDRLKVTKLAQSTDWTSAGAILGSVFTVGIAAIAGGIAENDAAGGFQAELNKKEMDQLIEVYRQSGENIFESTDTLRAAIESSGSEFKITSNA
jgi:hypothetical protein